jgi:cytochrome c biogenesis factor
MAHDLIRDLVMFFVNIVLYAGAVIFSIVVLVAYIRTRRDSESWAVLDHATITRDTIVVGTLVLIMGSRVAYIPVAISSVPDLLLAASEC